MFTPPTGPHVSLDQSELCQTASVFTHVSFSARVCSLSALDTSPPQPPVLNPPLQAKQTSHSARVYVWHILII